MGQNMCNTLLFKEFKRNILIEKIYISELVTAPLAINQSACQSYYQTHAIIYLQIPDIWYKNRCFTLNYKIPTSRYSRFKEKKYYFWLSNE